MITAAQDVDMSRDPIVIERKLSELARDKMFISRRPRVGRCKVCTIDRGYNVVTIEDVDFSQPSI